MCRLDGHPWAVLVVLCLGFFMILLDTTIVNVAIPSMVDGLPATLDQVLWVVNVYVLVFAVLLITAGRLGDIYGQRRLFVVGLVLFTLASAVCGLAGSPHQLIVARAVQGIGGALLTPQTLALLMTVFPPDRRGAAFGMWGAIAGVAAVVGPTAGGLIVTHWGWRWVFFVNLPIGILVLLATYAVVPDIRPGGRHRLDLPGVVLATAGLTALTYGLIEGERHDWGTVAAGITIPQILGAGVVLLVVFLIVQKLEKSEPLLPFELLRVQNYPLMNVIGAAMSFCMLGMFLPLMIYFQAVLGLSALSAGMTVAPMSLVSLLAAPFIGRLVDRIGGKRVLMAGLTLFAAGMGYVDLVARTSSTSRSFLPGLLVAGLGMGGIFAPAATMAMRDVPPRLAGAASGVLGTTRQLGSVLGSAVIGAVLQNRLDHSLQDQAIARAGQLPTTVRAPFVAGFSGTAADLDVGRGSSGTLRLPAGLPAQLVHDIQRLAHDVFAAGFVVGMRRTLLVPIVLLLAAAVSCLAISAGRRCGRHRKVRAAPRHYPPPRAAPRRHARTPARTAARKGRHYGPVPARPSPGVSISAATVATSPELRIGMESLRNVATNGFHPDAIMARGGGALGHTLPVSQVDHGTFQSPKPSQTGSMGDPPITSTTSPRLNRW